MILTVELTDLAEMSGLSEEKILHIVDRNFLCGCNYNTDCVEFQLIANLNIVKEKLARLQCEFDDYTKVLMEFRTRRGLLQDKS